MWGATSVYCQVNCGFSNKCVAEIWQNIWLLHLTLLSKQISKITPQTDQCHAIMVSVGQCYAIVAKPENNSLVYTVIDTGQTGKKQYCVLNKGGTNSNEATNCPAKGLLPARSSMAYAEVILTIWFTSFNLQQGRLYKGEPWIGSSDLAIVYEVSTVHMVPVVPTPCNHATQSVPGF